MESKIIILYIALLLSAALLWAYRKDKFANLVRSLNELFLAPAHFEEYCVHKVEAHHAQDEKQCPRCGNRIKLSDVLCSNCKHEVSFGCR